MKMIFKVRAKLKKNIVNVKGIKRQVARSAFNIQREARQRVPVDTGRLRSSIHIEFLDNGLAARISTGAAGHNDSNPFKTIGYAHFQEFGTKFQSGTKYLRPSIEREIPKMIQGFKNEIIK